MKFKADLVIVAALLSLSIVLNAWQASAIRNFERQPHSYSHDQRFIDQAVARWAKFTGEPVGKAMKSRYAQVISLEYEVCVSLSLEKGSIGGNPVYCFDESTAEVTRSFENVE